VLSHPSAKKLRKDGAPAGLEDERWTFVLSHPSAIKLRKDGAPAGLEDERWRFVLSHPSAIKLRKDGAPAGLENGRWRCVLSQVRKSGPGPPNHFGPVRPGPRPPAKPQTSACPS
jgi:hypothetical protein